MADFLNDRYILKCTCIDEGNDFGMSYGQVGYYNRKAQTFSYKTLMSNNQYDWQTGVQSGHRNEYQHSFWDRNIPVTPEINNAQIYKKQGEIKKIKDLIDSIGDFTCEIYRVKTIVEKIS